jgi:hypothetical protein
MTLLMGKTILLPQVTGRGHIRLGKGRFNYHLRRKLSRFPCGKTRTGFVLTILTQAKALDVY